MLTTVPEGLPPVGLSRWAQLAPYLPVCKKTWMKLVEAGRAPQPQRLTLRTTVWRNEDIHAYLRSPASYRVETAGAE
ncbi:transcriptional regulator [Burkholderia multivorans]|uniref:helix-turn-helix transcriptional regulator n=1 Tax=Burkholderia multivorans TaxID=87883 RepID=UPI001C23E6EB|nr:transcriptional regulator [Burkholderia multivorans]MBU9615222.1 transcriptional regulator [Burkholderia multivorans]